MIRAALLAILLLPGIGFAAQIAWDAKSLRFLGDGVYPRMMRLKSGELLLTCDAGGKAIVRRSGNDGGTWSEPIVVAAFDHGICANADALELDDGRLLLFYNERPTDGVHPFAIRLTESRDGGKTWKRRADALYVADTIEANGCWEPAGVQLAGGEVFVFFANENPYRNSTEQEITLLRSRDAGTTWGPAEQFSFRAGARDGMPVPLILKDGTLIVAIEDEALTADRQLKPVILKPCFDDTAKFKSLQPGDPDRWGAVIDPWPDRVYAGAPFVRQLPGGETILSCQSNEGGREPQMVVYVGDSEAKNFAAPSIPFDLPRNIAGKWNALFVHLDGTIIALTSTRLQGRFGIWAINGRLR